MTEHPLEIICVLYEVSRQQREDDIIEFGRTAHCGIYYMKGCYKCDGLEGKPCYEVEDESE